MKNGAHIRAAGVTLATDLRRAKTQISKDARRVVKAGAGDAMAYVEKTIEEKPLLLVAVGFVVGGIVGWMLKR